LFFIRPLLALIHQPLLLSAYLALFRVQPLLIGMTASAKPAITATEHSSLVSAGHNAAHNGKHHGSVTTIFHAGRLAC
jgi:hypothetical protein